MPRISSIQVITDNTEEIINGMKEQVLRGLKAIGEEAEGFAKDECPVDTGFLRNSITHAMAGESPAIGSYASDDGTKSGSYGGSAPAGDPDKPSVYIGSNVEYAPYVEYIDASHKVGKAHFLRDAIQNNMARYKEIMEASLS